MEILTLAGLCIAAFCLGMYCQGLLATCRQFPHQQGLGQVPPKPAPPLRNPGPQIKAPAEWLASLPPWDGTPRLATWLQDYLGAVPESMGQREYLERVGTFFVRGMVKRALQPGCEFDYCLVLEGAQGSGQRAAVRALAEPWMADTPLDLTSKDSLLALPGKWVYEIAELGSLMRAEERKQKSFLSRQEDEYRPPYASRMTKVPRQNVFIGTTNEEEYLKDAVGARRFWPVAVVTPCDPAGLAAIREQLFAEALADVNAGKPCAPSTEEQRRLFDPEQVKRGMPTPFEDLLGDWLADRPTPFSMSEVAEQALKLPAEKLTPAVTTRIGIALRKLGCSRLDNPEADPGQRRLYVPPGATPGEAYPSYFELPRSPFSD